MGLKNAGAIITMYNISLNSPKILVNGAEGAGGVTSGVTYDRDAGTLTFNTAHFMSFQAVEANSPATLYFVSAVGDGKVTLFSPQTFLRHWWQHLSLFEPR